MLRLFHSLVRCLFYYFIFCLSLSLTPDFSCLPLCAIAHPFLLLFLHLLFSFLFLLSHPSPVPQKDHRGSVPHVPCSKLTVFSNCSCAHRGSSFLPDHSCRASFFLLSSLPSLLLLLIINILLFYGSQRLITWLKSVVRQESFFCCCSVVSSQDLERKKKCVRWKLKRAERKGNDW